MTTPASCVLCKENPAHLHCDVCVAVMCFTCFTKRHSVGNLSSHTFSTLQKFKNERSINRKEVGAGCEVCSKRTSTLYCPVCDLVLCVLCASNFHSIGSAVAHVTQYTREVTKNRTRLDAVFVADNSDKFSVSKRLHTTDDSLYGGTLKSTDIITVKLQSFGVRADNDKIHGLRKKKGHLRHITLDCTQQQLRLVDRAEEDSYALIRPFDDLRSAFVSSEDSRVVRIKFKNCTFGADILFERAAEGVAIIELVNSIRRKERCDFKIRIIDTANDGSGIVFEGFAQKKGKIKWSQRWLVVRGHYLFVFRAPGDDMPLNTIEMHDIPIEKLSKKQIVLDCEHRQFAFRTKTSAQRNLMVVILEELSKHSHKKLDASLRDGGGIADDGVMSMKLNSSLYVTKAETDNNSTPTFRNIDAQRFAADAKSSHTLLQSPHDWCRDSTWSTSSYHHLDSVLNDKILSLRSKRASEFEGELRLAQGQIRHKTINSYIRPAHHRTHTNKALAPSLTSQQIPTQSLMSVPQASSSSISLTSMQTWSPSSSSSLLALLRASALRNHSLMQLVLNSMDRGTNITNCVFVPSSIWSRGTGKIFAYNVKLINFALLQDNLYMLDAVSSPQRLFERNALEILVLSLDQIQSAMSQYIPYIHAVKKEIVTNKDTSHFEKFGGKLKKLGHSVVKRATRAASAVQKVSDSSNYFQSLRDILLLASTLCDRQRCLSSLDLEDASFVSMLHRVQRFIQDVLLHIIIVDLHADMKRHIKYRSKLLDE